MGAASGDFPRVDCASNTLNQHNSLCMQMAISIDHETEISQIE